MDSLKKSKRIFLIISFLTLCLHVQDAKSQVTSLKDRSSWKANVKFGLPLERTSKVYSSQFNILVGRDILQLFNPLSLGVHTSFNQNWRINKNTQSLSTINLGLHVDIFPLQLFTSIYTPTKNYFYIQFAYEIPLNNIDLNLNASVNIFPYSFPISNKYLLSPSLGISAFEKRENAIKNINTSELVYINVGLSITQQQKK